jgi:hypothetical protein
MNIVIQARRSLHKIRLDALEERDYDLTNRRETASDISNHPTRRQWISWFKGKIIRR